MDVAVENTIESVPLVVDYSVPEANLGTLKLKIDKLNKRAKKVGAEPVGLKVEFDCVKHLCQVSASGRDCWLTQAEIDANHAKCKLNSSYFLALPTGEKMAWYKVQVSGSTPKYDGWKFVAKLEAVTTDDGLTQNLIKTVPGEECPVEYADKIGCCDQCGKKRRRTATFVVAHEDGQFKVVGRNCIGDFLGGQDPEQIARLAEWMAELEAMGGESEDYFGGGCAPTGEYLSEFLGWVAALIAKVGWVSKSSAQFGGMSTAEAAFWMIRESEKEPKHITELRSEVGPLVAGQAALVADAIAWAKSNDDPNNSYLQNIKLIAGCAWMANKNAGYAASIVSSYLRHVDKLKMAERKAAKPVSEHVGKIKQRLDMVVTCERIFQSEGMFGTTGIHRMVDADGNDIVWFASPSAEWLTAGETYKIKATVVKHDDYKGRKQTNVNRVKMLLVMVDGELVELSPSDVDDEPVASGEKNWG